MLYYYYMLIYDIRTNRKTARGLDVYQPMEKEEYRKQDRDSLQWHCRPI